MMSLSLIFFYYFSSFLLIGRLSHFMPFFSFVVVFTLEISSHMWVRLQPLMLFFGLLNFATVLIDAVNFLLVFCLSLFVLFFSVFSPIFFFFFGRLYYFMSFLSSNVVFPLYIVKAFNLDLVHTCECCFNLWCSFFGLLSFVVDFLVCCSPLFFSCYFTLSLSFIHFVCHLHYFCCHFHLFTFVDFCLFHAVHFFHIRFYLS